MPHTRLHLALGTGLLGILACSNTNDPLGIHEGETEQADDGMPDGGDDGTMPTADEGGEGCDAPDPACTTNNACGNDEICVECACVPKPDECDDNGECLEDANCGPNESCIDCVCVHPCQLQKGAMCSGDADCKNGTCDPTSCICDEPHTCEAIDECQSDDDCSGNGTCNLDTCMCETVPCECQYGGPLCDGNQYCDGCSCQDVPGTTDPMGDCDADGTPIECTESTDLLGTEVACDAGAITTTEYFELPVDPAPETPMVRIVEYLDDQGYLTLRLFANATGSGAPYECSVIVPGVMMTDIGPDDVCEINPDGSYFFSLSPESASLALAPIVSLFARSESGMPYHYDDGDPLPNPCN